MPDPRCAPSLFFWISLKMMERKSRVRQTSARVSALGRWTTVCVRQFISSWVGETGVLPINPLEELNENLIRNGVSLSVREAISPQGITSSSQIWVFCRVWSDEKKSKPKLVYHPLDSPWRSVTPHSYWDHSLVLCEAAGSAEPARRRKAAGMLLSRGRKSLLCSLQSFSILPGLFLLSSHHIP